MIARLLTAAVAAALLASPALAHPHIFVDARLTVVFDSTGAVAGLRHQWTFDEAFSAWSVQGLDTNGDGIVSVAEMQDLANQDMEGLQEYGYYTFVGRGSDTLALGRGSNQQRSYENERTTLSFDLPLAEPYPMDNPLEIAVSDPEYYVAIAIPDTGSVVLENAPSGCTARIEPPRELSDELMGRLYSLGPEVTTLPPDLAAAVRGMAGAVVVSCAAGATPNPAALAEPMRVAQTPVAQGGSPFGGPPAEPGLNLPREGLLGWLQQTQQDFYARLSGALRSLQQDANAFWVLGGLSFLYGVFHAAGPGHGKVVIGSYMLANEREVRHGIALSFVAAMLQSLVAVAFVLIAAAILRLSSIAMDAAVNWIGIASYGLVALLGAWLLVRLLFGIGRHSHGASAHAAGDRDKAHRHLHGHQHHHDHHDHDHDHDNDDDHHHVVTPEQTRGDWREQLAVVTAVGLRPCTGALVVLVFALSQNLLPAGIAAVFLMGLGTAITVAVLATLAVGAKGLALRVAGAGGGAVAGQVLWWLEFAGALAVFGFGLMLLAASL